MEQPLDPVERQLLAQVANGSDDARGLLAAHWAVHGEPARGELLRVQEGLAVHPADRRLRADERKLLERHGERWLAPAVAAGFEREHLGFARGFLRVVEDDTFMPWAEEERWHASPEQAVGNARSARDDVFTLSLVMCTLIDGEHPLAGHDSPFDRLVALRNRQLALPAHLPAAIDHVLRVALAARAHCYPHAGAFGDALAQAADHAGIQYGPSVIAAMLGSLPPLPAAASRGGSG